MVVCVIWLSISKSIQPSSWVNILEQKIAFFKTRFENGDGSSIKITALQDLESRRKESMTRHEGRDRWKRHVANDIRPRHSGTAGSLPRSVFVQISTSKCCRGNATVRQSMATFHPPPLTSTVICCYTALWRRQLFDVGSPLTLEAL